MVGGASAALTGLLFVAMSLHLRQISRSLPVRRRARGTLTGLVAVLLVAAVALVPGLDLRTFGVILVLGALGMGVQAAFVIRGLAIDARWHPSRSLEGWRLRSALYPTILLFVAAIGALLVMLEARALFALAATICAVMAFMVVNTWGLLLDLTTRE